MYHTITGTIIGVISQIKPSFQTNKGRTIRILEVKEIGGVITYPQLHDSEPLLENIKQGDKVSIDIKVFGNKTDKNGREHYYHTLVIQGIEKLTTPQTV